MKDPNPVTGKSHLLTDRQAASKVKQWHGRKRIAEGKDASMGGVRKEAIRRLMKKPG